MKTKMEMLEEAVQYMEHIAACPEHGYSQSDRLGTDFDCSSLISRGLNHAGFDIKPNNTTRTLKEALMRIGFKITSRKGNKKRGDILLTPGSHVAMMVSARKLVHAVADENGGKSGGKPGDQTGKEILVTDFYNRTGGWTYMLRLEESGQDDLAEVVDDVIAGKYGNGEYRKKNLEAIGYDYSIIQNLVNEKLKGR